MIDNAKLKELYEQCIAEREIATAMWDEKRMDYEGYRQVVDRLSDTLLLIEAYEKLKAERDAIVVFNVN